MAGKDKAAPTLAEFAAARNAKFVRCPLCRAPQDIQKQVSDAVKDGSVPRRAVVEWLKSLGYQSSPSGVVSHVENHTPA